MFIALGFPNIPRSVRSDMLMKNMALLAERAIFKNSNL